MSNYGSPAAFYWTSNCEQIAVSSIKDKCQSLMGHPKEACGSCDAPARLFQGSTDEAAFITKDFGIERKARRQSHLGGCGCCLFGGIKCNCKNALGTFAQACF